MPQLAEEAADDIQEKRAETCAPLSLAACPLLEEPTV